ncbi:hypothetical protein [Streptomyces vilmorinianum]|uniref:hypothetical protein n=1 Tax=Streptomyces vilmorinianum TaxID=3051092 RepID=UPI0010FAFD94|nr:hypothetical protein [Streptomyces vilmorinianum]
MTRKLTTKRIGAAVAAAAAACALGLGTAGTAVAGGINPVPVSCTNEGGNEPGGQQPECKGKAHTQETENQNKPGHAPPGQNK